jgi:hypothetical protein
MIIPPETPYRLLKYFNKLFLEKQGGDTYPNEKIILHLKDRAYLTILEGRVHGSKTFDDAYLNNIQPVHVRLQTFIDQHSLQSLENHYSIGEFETLLRIEKEKDQIISSDFSLQQILSFYFNSSKYTHTSSNLSKAIKSILCLEEFPEEGKNLQSLSVLYPTAQTKAIVLCENFNRLRMPRHPYIEFWYAGGKNTEQLAYCPKPMLTISYLCDWDHDGINTYLHIKERYFPDIRLFIPLNYQDLMTEQESVKKHRSKWTPDSPKILQRLDGKERDILEVLMSQNKIIEEQKILLTDGHVAYNLEIPFQNN